MECNDPNCPSCGERAHQLRENIIAAFFGAMDEGDHDSHIVMQATFSMVMSAHASVLGHAMRTNDEKLGAYVRSELSRLAEFAAGLAAAPDPMAYMMMQASSYKPGPGEPFRPTARVAG